MTRPRHSKEPTFFWQGTLILLPVVLLAGLGLMSLRQDRRLAEQDARERAAGLVDQFSAALSHYEIALPVTDSLGPAVLGKSGNLLFPHDWASTPEPAEWFAQLSTDQAEAWERATAITATSASSADVLAAWNRFAQTGPPAAARTNAAFALLRFQLRTNTASPLEGLFSFAAQNLNVQTETGLPLPAVACALALGTFRQAELTEPLSELLRLQLQAPCLLTSDLLATAERFVQSRSGQSLDAVRGLVTEWQEQERLRELVHRVQDLHVVRELSATNCWTDNRTERWLALVTTQFAPTSSPQLGTSPTNGAYVIRFLSRRALEVAVADGLRVSGIPIPAYCALQVDLEGEGLDLSARGSHTNLQDNVSALLASSPGVLTIAPAASRSRSDAIGLASAPAQARFKLALFLADPALLYARQRQRTLWFGAFIVAVALAAVLADPALLYARQRQRTLWFGAFIVAVALAAVIG
jgi:hypothetical protein